MTARYLSTFLNYEKNLNAFSSRNVNLARVRAVLSKLNSPQKYLKAIHIAGSKGKGSTAAFVAQILSQAGYKVGLYTSPHLYHLRERFRILDASIAVKALGKDEIFSGCISQKQFGKLIKKIRPVLEAARHHPKFGDLTYFEVLTIAAFCYFYDEKVDFAVLETGLGGRLDATNVCQPFVAAISSISLEHTQQLGKTLRKIAFEKAGIIKKNSAVVLALQSPEVLKVIKARSAALNVVPMIAEKNIFKISLLGEHQNTNAALAVGIIQALRARGFSVDQAAVKKGLAGTFWPLRFEIVGKNPAIVLDAAHNPQSCQKLAETIKKIFPSQKVILIFGSSYDKDIRGMAPHLQAISQKVILTRARHPRALGWTQKLAKEIFEKEDFIITASVKEACSQALRLAGKKSVIVVTGSLFVAAEARKIL